ncbi:MAG: FimB/Mfa2 family fimbrial subunit [Bacteroidales bacterium]
MLKRLAILILLGIMVFLSGCTKEDTDDCVQGIQLRFTYTLNNQHTNLFGAKVGMVTVYVFDQAGKYVDTFSSKGVVLSNEYVMTLPLKSGQYSFIALGGDLLTYRVGEMFNSQAHKFVPELIKGKTSIEDFAFLLDDNPPSDQPVLLADELSHLFYGKLADFIAPAGKISSATIDLMKDTKTINVHIIGYSYLEPLTRDYKETRTDFTTFFDLNITSKNGRYRYDNSIGEYAYPLLYKFRQPTASNDTFKTNTRVLRLMAENDPSELHVSYPGNDSFYSVNMVKEIKKNPQYNVQEDFDREDEFTFVIKIDPSLNVTISINGWVIQSIVPNKKIN